MKTPFLFFTCLALLSLLLLSCNSTSNKTGTVSGFVTLVNDSGVPANDPVDFAGVNVLLYKPAVLDTTLVRLNSEYPQIGVLISQETEFDHRTAQVVKSTISAADGSFSITDVDTGTYNMAVFKEQWGVRYIYGVEVTKDETNNLGTVELYPATEYNSFATEDVIFKSDHTYIIQGDTNFIGACTFQPRAAIYVNPGYSAKFYGAVSTPSTPDINNAWKIMSAKDIYTTVQVALVNADYFFSAEFHGDTVSLHSGIIHQVSNTVALIGGNCTIDHIIIEYCGGGVSVQQGYANISNLIIANGAGIGIQISSLADTDAMISGCILSRMNDGMTIYIGGEYNISNCYFHSNQNALRPDNCTGVITHNAFDLNRQDIFENEVHTAPEITYNDFYICTFRSIFPKYTANIHNNNFYQVSEYFIWIRAANAPPNYAYVFGNIDATNNYWKPSDVDQYLLDGTDNIDFPQQPCAFYVLYNPRRTYAVSSAGIQ